ncbi:hypothetical protein HY641_01635 [Candidatus Woesearchaeota archaeon]|nr:hypothetical protein [Candidatus Woesearchaeota archaeon]
MTRDSITGLTVFGLTYAAAGALLYSTFQVRNDMMPDTEAFLKTLHKRIYKMPKDEVHATARELETLTTELSNL